MKFGVVVFPGSNCDHDAFYAIGNVLHKPVEFIWHQSEDLRLRRHHPARWIFVRRLSPHRRHRAFFASNEVRREICQERRHGPGHLQRLSDSLRSGPAPRRDDAQLRPALYLSPSAHSRRSRPTRPSRTPRKRDRSSKFPSRTTMAITLATKPRSPTSKKIAKSFSANTQLADGPEELTTPAIPTAPCTTSPESATANATSPASCPIPNAPSNPLSTPADGLVILRSMVEAFVGAAKATA